MEWRAVQSAAAQNEQLSDKKAVSSATAHMLGLSFDVAIRTVHVIAKEYLPVFFSNPFEPVHSFSFLDILR